MITNTAPINGCLQINYKVYSITTGYIFATERVKQANLGIHSNLIKIISNNKYLTVVFYHLEKYYCIKIEN